MATYTVCQYFIRHLRLGTPNTMVSRRANNNKFMRRPIPIHFLSHKYYIDITCIGVAFLDIMLLETT